MRRPYAPTRPRRVWTPRGLGNSLRPFRGPAQRLFELNLFKQQVCHEAPQSSVLILQCCKLSALFQC